MNKPIKNEDGVEFGMFCGFGCFRDRHAGKVIAITSKTFTVAEVRAIRTKTPHVTFLELILKQREQECSKMLRS